MDKEFIKLKNIIADVLNVDPDEISEDTTFADDLGADSLDLEQILMGLESEFSITVARDKVEGITTVGEALEMIQRELGVNE